MSSFSARGSLPSFSSRLLSSAPRQGNRGLMPVSLRAAQTEGPGEAPEGFRGLNDRLKGYLDRVRGLEERRRGLERELGPLRRRRRAQEKEAAEALELLEGQLRELRWRREKAEAGRAQAALERGRLGEAVEALRARCQEEAQAREEAQAALRERLEEAQGWALSRAALERKAEALREEREALRRNMARLSASELHPPQPPTQASSEPGLAAALRELRAQYEEALAFAEGLQAEEEEWFQAQLARLSHQAARAAGKEEEELGQCRRELQARTLEAERLRGLQKALRGQLQEACQRHQAQALELQDTISQLESDLRDTKSEMAQHLREYQDLLNAKMALDIEIAAYRKLLEGEETHLSTSSINIPSLNPVSSPVYSFQPRLFSSSVVSSSKISPTLSFKKK